MNFKKELKHLSIKNNKIMKVMANEIINNKFTLILQKTNKIIYKESTVKEIISIIKYKQWKSFTFCIMDL